MKNMEIKSIIIGVLSATLLFVIIGANKQSENLGDVTVTSLRVVNWDGVEVANLYPSEDGGVISINNNRGDLMGYLQAGENGVLFTLAAPGGREGVTLETDDVGNRVTLYKKEKPAAKLEGGKGANGLWIYNLDGEQVAILGADHNLREFSGTFTLLNYHETLAAIIGAHRQEGGIISLYDRNGNMGWGEMAR